jgi:hypothetical protein
MSDKPTIIQHQVHTVLLTADKRQGVALGVNPAGETFRIWLMTPRAVKAAQEKLSAVARSLGTKSKRIKAPQETIRGSRNCCISGIWRHDREWSMR